MPRPPLIGVTPGYAGPSDQREFCKTAEILYCDLSYMRCVELAGGVPLLLPYVGVDSLKKMCVSIDGLLLTGGEDIHPGYYDQDVLYHNRVISKNRDNFEISLLKGFLQSGKPVLAICRGIQVLNVAMGGTLFQDLPSQIRQSHHVQRPATTVATHHVRLDDHSRIFKAVKTTVLEVNSHHHQAVDQVAPELKAVGWSEEGVVEVVEHRGKPYLMGVQWHPERLAAAQPTQHRIFTDFVQACMNEHECVR